MPRYRRRRSLASLQPEATLQALVRLLGDGDALRAAPEETLLRAHALISSKQQQERRN